MAPVVSQLPIPLNSVPRVGQLLQVWVNNNEKHDE